MSLTFFPRRCQAVAMTTPRATAAMLAAATLWVLAGPAAATNPGARCPASSNTASVTPVFSNNILRCQQRAVASPVCPPTHLNYDVRAGADICRTVNVAVPPPGPLTATPQCASGMAMAVDGGAGNRDQCRGSITYVTPMTGNY